VKNTSGKLLTSNEQAFDVFTEKQLRTPSEHVAVLDEVGGIREHLESKGMSTVTFSQEIDLSVPVIVGRGKKEDQYFQHRVDEVKTFVERGGYAIFLELQGPNLTWGAPNPDPRPEDAGDDWQFSIPRVLQDMDVDRLPFHASIYTSSGNYISRNHIVRDHAVFNGLPVNTLMSGVYENVCPKSSIVRPAEGELLAGVITYDQNKNMDIMQRHYNGIGDVLWAADVLLVKEGQGKMLYSTLQIPDKLGKDPVADILLYNMIRLN